MPEIYTEADYENSVIELFRNDLGYLKRNLQAYKKS
jgi:hypothetical protein